MKDGMTCDSPLSGAARPEKALWYQEVLTLDPHSRIFLPYARLLAELSRKDEAIHILKTGLAKHPEFLEARLLLIQLLHETGQDSSAGLESSDIIDLLSQYPALWEIWSHKPGIRADQSAMLLFFSFCLGKTGLDLAAVFRAGIESLTTHSITDTPGEIQAATSPVTAAPVSDDPAAVPTGSPASAPVPPQEENPVPGHAFVMTEDTPWYSLDSVPEDDDIFDEESSGTPAGTGPVLPDTRSLLSHFQKEPSAQSTYGPDPRPVPRAAIFGKCSLHTRSMASVLEEQGAYSEAASIYRELLKSCSSEEERSELQAKLETLDVRGEGSASPSPDNSAMMAMLEELAVRLENKSRA